MSCFTCKFWDRKWATTNNGEIHKGIVCDCLVPFNLPDNLPAALVMGKTKWDDGAGCGMWEQFDGPIEIFTWPE